MEVKRQLDVLDKHLEYNKFICGPNYTIADIAIWAWYGQLALGRLYDASEFLNVDTYKNVIEWANKIDNRPAVKRGLMVNKVNGDLKQQLHERHHSLDLEAGTQDKR